MRLIAALIAAGVLAGAAVPKVTFIKDFKGATPPYFSIELNKEGAGVYKEGPNDEQPVSFTLPAEATSQIFTHLENVENGKRQLESGLKVANLGQKTIRYENGTEKHEVSFNYSLDPEAQALADMFERIFETQQHMFRLEYSLRFDKLGVNKVLLQIESAWDRNRLIGQERFVPLLEKVVKNETILNMARERAAKLSEAFQHPKPKAGND